MNDTNSVISFDNTEYAFAYKSTSALRKAKYLFSSMDIAWLVRLGTSITPWAMNIGLPVDGLVRATIFEQFVGGETLVQTAKVADKLEEFNVQVILDYGVEGKTGEENFNHACEEFIRVINYAAAQPNIPFMSIKVTGFARFNLLEKLDKAAGSGDGVSGKVALECLDEKEKLEWVRVVHRMEKIINAASAQNVGVLVDAEESWIQDPVDALTMQMMKKFNHGRTVVYNTIQLYRHDRLKFLKDSALAAGENNFILGAKLVRGAYMEKERRRAKDMDYSSPVQPDKNACDRDYNAAIEFCISRLDNVAFIVASHNEESNQMATRLLTEKGISLSHPHVHFSQLYGMSDNITFNLAKAGCSVSKYLPFGPIKDVIPYLMRRAHENSSVSGHTGRELALIRKELKRRGATKALS